MKTRTNSGKSHLISLFLAVFCVVFASFGAAATAANSELGIEKGKKAPNIAGKNLVNGKNISLKEMTAQGKYVWVLFWRLWSCGHCRQQLNEVEMVYKEVKAMGGEVLALSTNSVEHTKQVVKELALEFPIIADPEAKFVKKYEVFNLDDTFARPSTFVVNNKGEIIFKHVATDITNRVPPNTVLDVFRAFLGPAPASAPLNP